MTVAIVCCAQIDLEGHAKFGLAFSSWFASSIAQQVVRYRCRKCRQLIATERNVIPQEGVGRRIFRRQQHRPQQEASTAAAKDADAQGNMEQGAVFLEPISWMADQVVGPVQGKLYCPNCSARLGTFNWSGMLERFQQG